MKDMVNASDKSPTKKSKSKFSEDVQNSSEIKESSEIIKKTSEMKYSSEIIKKKSEEII